MIKVADICDWMDAVAPLALSESWDNTGLLLGCPELEANRVQTCLTLTQETTSEAIERSAQLVIVHHPLPFKALKRMTTQTAVGSTLWRLANAGCGIYAPHTSWDSAEFGINALLAEKLNLQGVEPIIDAANPDYPGLGAGRIGDLPDAMSAEGLAALLSDLPGFRPRAVFPHKSVSRIAIACGSGGSLLSAGLAAGCDLFFTGEATYHTCLEAEAAGCGLLMVGHYASERFAMEQLAQKLAAEFPTVECWASEQESDPVKAVELP